MARHTERNNITCHKQQYHACTFNPILCITSKILAFHYQNCNSCHQTTLPLQTHHQTNSKNSLFNFIFERYSSILDIVESSINCHYLLKWSKMISPHVVRTQNIIIATVRDCKVSGWAMQKPSRICMSPKTSITRSIRSR